MKLGKGLAIVGAILAVVVLAFKFWFLPNMRRHAEDKSIATYQIAAAVDQFILENPDRVFVQFNDLVGPGKFVMATFPVAGEDYHELFPFRVDFEELGVTMGDGRRVIVLCLRDPATLGMKRYTVRQWPNGKLEAVDSHPEGPEVYRHWQEAGRRPDGVHVSKFWDRRFETTYHGGVPDGPFRAYYESGELWAEATYIKGRPVGPHVLYARNGKRIYETTFAPR